MEVVVLVKNVIKSTAEMLGLSDVVAYLNEDIDGSDDILGELKNLLIAVNMTNNNIASNYIELKDIFEINNQKEKILFSDITSKNIIEIKKVTNDNDCELDYQILPDGINCVKGNIKITYSYFPDYLTIDDSISYYLKINDLVFALGVAGEYLYLKGAIDDAYMWDKRFKQNMLNLLRPKRNVIIKPRRWS